MNIPSESNMLLSFINLKLRDQYSSLEEMIDDLDLDKMEIMSKIKDAGIVYDAVTNQLKFR